MLLAIAPMPSWIAQLLEFAQLLPVLNKIKLFLSDSYKPCLIHLLFNDIGKLLNLDRFIIKQRRTLAQLRQTLQLIPCLRNVTANFLAWSRKLTLLGLAQRAQLLTRLTYGLANGQKLRRTILAHVFRWNRSTLLLNGLTLLEQWLLLLRGILCPGWHWKEGWVISPISKANFGY